MDADASFDSHRPALFNLSNPFNSFNCSRARERGIALVITLILLSVITFMAVTFLVVTQSERKSVVTLTDQMAAKAAAESGLEFVKIAVLAPMVASNNMNTLGFLVSTNFINPNGYVSGDVYDPLNVNYDYKAGGGALSVDDLLENISNLRYLPRAPVVVTNTIYGSNEFRFFVDMNRNGKFDPTGLLSYTNQLGQQVSTNSGFYWGDPQWIGILERPGFLHSPSNFFIGRFAFMIVPSSTTLDINSAHNFCKGAEAQGLGFGRMTVGTGDHFLRDMGVGTFEINLGAFFTDLNTNYWPPTNAPTTWGQNYSYTPLNINNANQGAGFEDAVALLRYRYSTNRDTGNLNVQQLFGTRGLLSFPTDFIDGYSAGPVMTGFHWGVAFDPEFASVSKNVGWPGSENTNRFYDLQELFDNSKSAINVGGPLTISNRLATAGASLDTYNRYTFYRMAAQLGTDSAPDNGKQNLNYVNIDTNNNVVPDMVTNFVGWKAEQFFTNTAVRLLQDAFTQPITNILSTNVLAWKTNGLFSSNAPAGFNTQVITNYVTNLVDLNGHLKIQIYPTNFYTPAVQRLLQLAANLYDASNGSNRFPSVFRPIFQDDYPAGTNVYIVGYTEITNANLLVPAPNTANPFPVSFKDPALLGTTNRPVLPFDMVYGVPVIIGAKKGFPSFNRFSAERDIQVRRDLLFHRNTSGGPIVTNQAYTFSISNLFGVEAWNSYQLAYTNPLQIVAIANLGFGITRTNNQTSYAIRTNGVEFEAGAITSPLTNFIIPVWPGAGASPQAANQPSFTISIPVSNSNQWYMPPVYYRNADTRFLPANINPTQLDPNNTFPVPAIWLTITNRVRMAIVDTRANRIIDYVNLSSAEDPLDVMDLATRDSDGQQFCGGVTTSDHIPRVGAALFCTNVTKFGVGGVFEQWKIAEGVDDVDTTVWSFCGLTPQQVLQEKLAFSNFMAVASLRGPQRAPLPALRLIHHYTSWQVNDPLVHYIVPDLLDHISIPASSMVNNSRIQLDDKTEYSPMLYFVNTGYPKVNDAYRPWGINGLTTSETASPILTLQNMLVKDSLVTRSDDWDFPTNKYPTVGMIGRVHRGTPWKTVDLKSPAPDTVGTWGWWVSHNITNWDGFGSILFDAVRTDPTNDYRLVDLFTANFNDNSAKGKLSVNQTNLAAWSAALGGVAIVSNVLGATNLTYVGFIQPAGIYTNDNAPLAQIVAGINAVRTNPPFNGSFSRLADILNVPQLTTNSPYLDPNRGLVSDEVYERIPQQVLGLLRGGDQPRFVVYAFGQALRPAERSIMNNGPYFGVCTNYQVTAESTIRAVVRIDGSADPAQANNPDPAKRFPPRAVVESYNVIGPYY